VIGHLGARVSALLDGQLPPDEAEAAWNHVYACHACRDLVEREGWVKTRLAGLSGETSYVPDGLRGSLLSLPPGDRFLLDARSAAERRSGRRNIGVAVLGGGAVGAAMMGVLVLGLAPGSNPGADRRPPASRVDTPVSTPLAGSATPAPTPAPAMTVSSPASPGSAEVLPTWVSDLLP